MNVTLKKADSVYYHTQTKQFNFIKSGMTAGAIVQDLRLQRDASLNGLIQACRFYPTCKIEL